MALTELTQRGAVLEAMQEYDALACLSTASDSVNAGFA